MKRIVCFLILSIMIPMTNLLVAQEKESRDANPNSVYPVNESDIMYKKRIWRRMDLTEKQNRSFFSGDKGLTKFIINAVINGELTPYQDDSLTGIITKVEFLENMKDPALSDLAQEDDGFGSSDGGWGDTGDWGGENFGFEDEEESATGEEAAASPTLGVISPYLLPSQISVIEIVEDMIFDKHRSRMYFDVMAISLKIPAKYDPAGLERKIASFKYKDLHDLFKSNPESALWFNPQNSAAHLNFADAFFLRMFNARIIKIANSDDNYIADIYLDSQEEALNASIDSEYDLIEFENEMWEY